MQGGRRAEVKMRQQNRLDEAMISPKKPSCPKFGYKNKQ